MHLIRIRIPAFLAEYRSGYEKNLIFFLKKNLQFTYPQASIKDVQATEEAFSPQSEHPALQNMKFPIFSIFVGYPGSRSETNVVGSHWFQMRIRIQLIISMRIRIQGDKPMQIRILVTYWKVKKFQFLHKNILKVQVIGQKAYLRRYKSIFDREETRFIG